MPDTYTLLEKVTVGAAGASSITFTNIPQSYNDLVIRMSGRTTYGSNIGDNITVTANGNAITTVRSVYGAGSGNIASVLDPFITAAAQATANTFNNGEFLFSNYSGSTAKSVLFDGVVENNATAAFQFITSGMFTSTSPITSITMAGQAGGSSWVQGSTFYLYGVTRLNVTPLSAPKATGGDIIVSDGTYWIHTFLSSGTFRPLTSLTCDYLVVAGGGGGSGGQGSWTYGGGGGAGGYRTSAGTSGGNSPAESPLSLAANVSVTVTVGAGGAGTTDYNTQPGLGSNSVFSTITSTGGGGGGNFGVAARNGGSGGGVGVFSSANGVLNITGKGTTNQGTDGGTGLLYNSSTNRSAGGGGGASGAGGNASGTTAGAGGAGIASTISGSSVTRAGGGGGASLTGTGGAGGSGGGGTGTSVTTSSGGAGTVNTGGGGGGASQNDNPGVGTGGNGGSGIVIVRYAV